jgi:hypothetical protein
MTSNPRQQLSSTLQPLAVLPVPSGDGMRLIDRGVMAAYVFYATQERNNGRMPADFDNWLVDTGVPVVIERNERARN